MIPLVVPIGLFVGLAVLRRASTLSRRYSLVDAAAWSLSALLLLTGSAHFGSMRDDLIRMVPPMFPRADVLVTITGIFELLGAIGLMLRPTRNVAGVALVVLFIALLPANIYAARAGLTLGGSPVTPLWIRIPEQLLYIAFALAPVWDARARR